jgi:predicted nucleic acid-binding protein
LIVVDPSAVVDLVAVTVRSGAVRSQVELAGRLVAPDCLFVEVCSAVWRLCRAGELTAGQADRAIVDLRRLPLAVIPGRGLIESAWSFRQAHRISDSFYLACALSVGATLLTTDARLARGHHGVPITLVT